MNHRSNRGVKLSAIKCEKKYKYRMCNTKSNTTAIEAFHYTAKRYFLTKNTAAVLMRVTRCCSVSVLEGREAGLPSTHDDNHVNTSLTSWKLGAVKFSRDTRRGKPRERRCSTKSETKEL